MNFWLCNFFLFLSLCLKLFLSIFLLLFSYLLSLSQKPLFPVLHWLYLSFFLNLLNNCWDLLNFFILLLRLLYFLDIFYWELFLKFRIFVESTSEWRQFWKFRILNCKRGRFQRLEFGSFFLNRYLGNFILLFLLIFFLFLGFLLNSISCFLLEWSYCLALFGWNFRHFNSFS